MLSSNSKKNNDNSIILTLIVSAFFGVSISIGDFYLFHFIVIIFFISQFYQTKKNKYRLNVNNFLEKYSKIIFVFCLWYLISLFWAPSLEMGIKYIFYIFCGTTIVYSVTFYTKNMTGLNKFFRLMSFLISLEILIALIESFTNFRMPISSYSSIAYLFGKEHTSFFEYDKILYYSNLSPPTGFRWNTNDLAISMVIALPFFLCINKNFVKLFGVISIVIIIVLTASRAVFLAMLLSFLVYFIFIKKKIGTLLFILFISSVILMGMFNLAESENPRINEIANSVKALSMYLSGQVDVGGSLQWRRELIENGMRAFTNTYGLGLGAGGSTANQEIVGAVDGRFTSMHNFWIELLVEGGLLIAVIIFLAFLKIVTNLFFISRNTNNQKLKYYSESLFISVVNFVPAAVAASSTIYFFPMWILLGFSISVMLAAEREINHEK